MFSFKTRPKEEKTNSEERIRELEALVEELEHNLIHDRLTGLKTRAYFEEETELHLGLIRIRESGNDGAKNRREEFGFKSIGIIFFDIDHFKRINDTYGHDAGDVVLKSVANTIKQTLRASDTVARWGGEEMVASLLGAEESDALKVAEEVRKKVENIDFPEIPDLKVTISAGVTSSDKSLALFELVKQADEALYEAKKTGRNKVVSCSQINQ